MSVSGIEALGFQPYVAPQLSTDAVTSTAGTAGTAGTTGASGASSAFGDLLVDGLDRLEAVQDKSDKLAVQAATGDLNDMHDYTVAATEASVTAQLTVAVRNRALEAFNEIMRMPIG
jgi:flagellar hook-basal body complex protein FliE